MHQNSSLVLACTIPLFAAAMVFAQTAQRNYPPQMPEARTEIYKTVDGTKLRIYVYTPKAHEPNERRPAIVFFFGGGWRGGTPKQFEQHCRYLASRGMIAMTADYRVSSRNQTKAKACVMDGKSAIRWIRQNAPRLGVDEDRVVAGGGSAGGHVAACTATLDHFEHPGEDHSISSRPDALALFNPALVLASIPGNWTIEQAKLDSLRDRLGVEPRNLSPFHQLQPGLPPTIVFHGKSDTTVPYRTAELFVEKARANGDLIVLDGHAGQTHGFFNFGRNDNGPYKSTVKRLDNFLVDIGFLEGPSPSDIKVPTDVATR